MAACRALCCEREHEHELKHYAFLLFSGEDEEEVAHTYVDMIRVALTKLPDRQGNLPTIFAYIEVSRACRGRS